MKKYYIKTYGCQANVRDTQNISGLLDYLGFKSTNDYKLADVVIINTCSVRQKAQDKVYGWGLDSKKCKEGSIIIVTGCTIGSGKGQRKRYNIKEIEKKISWADYLLSSEEHHLIPKILQKEKFINNWMDKVIKGDMNNLYKYIRPKYSNNTKWAYVNISTGCDNFCAFCVVPYARGQEVSRDKKNILDEIKYLSSKGNKNIMLLGQNVNSYGLGKEEKFKLRSNSNQKLPFADLLREVIKIKDVEKISFMSSNPFDFTEDLINVLDSPKIDKYLHIAVQSGNDEILRKMNRRHTIFDFINLINKIKDKVPDMKFGTDIIVGFPGETNDQFMDTVNLVKTIKFVNIYISLYSKRKGTNADKFYKDDVSLKEKRRRHEYLTKVK